MQKHAKRTEEINLLSSNISKLLKEKCGKGPETCLTIARQQYIVFYLKNFMTPMEEILVEGGHNQLVRRVRMKVVQSIYTEIKSLVKGILGKEIKQFYQDWNFEKETGAIIAKVDLVENHIDSISHTHLINVFQKITGDIQRQPRQVTCFQLNSSAYLIECTEVLLSIERTLVSKGYKDLILENQHNLKALYFNNIENIEQALERKVEDLFIDWDYESDKCVINLILNKE